MGHGMAGRYLEAGFTVAVWNRSKAKAEDLIARGAQWATSPEDAAIDADAVVTMVADDAASRIEMLLIFLRVSGRADASALFDGASRHPAFHLRWSAMREWLMLDAGSARNRLAEMCARDPNAEVRAAAAATLPLLDRRLERRCRA